MNRKRILKLSFAVFFLVLYFVEKPLCSDSERFDNTLNPHVIQKAAKLSADYLIRECGDNGRFTYRINLNPKVTPRPKYNMLRHGGTIYALAMYDQKHPNKKTKKALDRATRFLKKNIAPIPGKDDLLTVWSYPEISGRRAPVQAKLGGTGLGLVALLSVEKIKPGTTPVSYLRRMGQFLLFMQKKDGSFYSKYVPAEGGRTDKWTSLYYPGEAALGLLMLYEKDPSMKWLQSAANAIAYLARIRAKKKSVEADHWALLATAELLPICDRNKSAFPRKKILRHAIQICESIVSRKATHPEDEPEYGCFTRDGRTCPTATRLEGLQAALTFLPKKNETLRKRIESTVSQGLSFLIRSQIPSGKYAGGIPKAIRPLPKNHPRFDKSFNYKATEIRVDYVQHALSAMIWAGG